MITWFKSIWQAVMDWLTAEESARKVALFRIVFGTVIFLNVLLMAGHLVPYFSSAGFYSTTMAHSLANPLAFSLFYVLGDGPVIVYAAYVILVVACLLFIVGWRSRLMAIILFVLYTSFEMRNPLLFHAGDDILRIALFYTCFLQTDRAFVLPMLKRVSARSVPGWPVKLIQFQMACIYLSAGISKVESPQWWDGSYAYRMLTLPGRGYFSWHWLLHMPTLANLLTYSVIWMEISFFFLVWFESTRRLAVIQAALLHLGILATVNVVYFSEIMLSILFLFTLPRDGRDLRIFLTQVRSSVSKKLVSKASIVSLK